jgi:hypothetical protein
MHEELRSYIDAQPMIDTHSHVCGFDEGPPLDDKLGYSLPQILMRDYLLYLTGSCGEMPARPGGGEWTVDDAEEHFLALQPLLEEYRGLTTYAALREGIRELHPFDGEDITPANWRGINNSIVNAYRTHGERAWLRKAAQQVGIKRQNQMVVLSYVTESWGELPDDEREAQKNFLMPSLILDGLFYTGFPRHKEIRQHTMEIVGLQPKTYDEHLEFCEKVLDTFIAQTGPSRTVKVLAAYARSLFFAQDVPDSRAKTLYLQDPETLTGEPLRELQDNLFWKIMQMVVDRGLPLIVHTGYSYPSAFGDPENLMNLAQRHRALKIDLAHSGWPNQGGGLMMARSIRGCYFNLCWTPLMSYELGRHIMSVAIDMTPRNKILVGTDCGTVECLVGTARLLRRVLGDVLEEKLRLGQINLDVAKSYSRAILYDNPREFYGLPVVVEA